MPPADESLPPKGVTAADLLSEEEGGQDDGAQEEGSILAGDDDSTEETETEETEEEVEEGDEVEETPAAETKAEDDTIDLSAIKIEGEDEPVTTPSTSTPAKIADDPEYADLPEDVDEFVTKLKPVKVERISNAVKAVKSAVELDELDGSVGAALTEALEEMENIARAEHDRRRLQMRGISRRTKTAESQAKARDEMLDKFVDTIGLPADLIGKSGTRGDAQKAIVTRLVSTARAIAIEVAKSGKKMPDDATIFRDAARRLKIGTESKTNADKPGKKTEQWGRVLPTSSADKPKPSTPTRARQKNSDRRIAEHMSSD